MKLNQSPALSLTLSTSVCPIISVQFAATALCVSRERVQALIEDGQLRYSWSLGKDGRRSFVRILCQSVIEYQNRLPDLAGDHDGVMRILFPVATGNPTVAEIEKLFFCDARMILGHAHAGRIKLVTPRRRGKGGSPRVARASLFQFLDERRIA